MKSLLDQFLSEAGDLLEQVDAGLLDLERDPANRALLDVVFRSAHTLKGSSGLFDLPELTRLTHAAEDLLDAVRGGRFVLTAAMTDDLLTAFDLIRCWLDEVANSGSLPSGAGSEGAALSERLRAPLGATLTAGGASTAGGVPRPRSGAEPGPAPVLEAPSWLATGLGPERSATVLAWLQQARTTCRVVRFAPDEQCFFTGADPLHLVRQIPAIEALAVAPREPWPGLADFDEYRCLLEFTLVTRASVAELEHAFRYVLDEVTIAEVDAAALARLLDPAAEPEPAAPTPESEQEHEQDQQQGQQQGQQQEQDQSQDQEHGERRAGPADRRAGGSASRVLKVDQASVDRLLDLVGQLVVAKNGLPFLATAADVTWNARPLARQIKEQYGIVDRISEELQAAVMDVRMLPISVAFSRFPRMVRDLARNLGKEVVLELEGEDTAADKDIIDMLADPLVHLIRNSLDHGVELPHQRVAAGKPAQATVRLSAVQEPDAVVIDVVDDGRGIDPRKIKAKACGRDMITLEEAEAMSDEEAVNLVFGSGFSTAEQVSDVSGRGVGMDAVRASIEAAGGSVHLTSTPGAGSRVRLRVPLSMAVSRVMIVTIGGQRYGVPIDVVTETVRVPRARIDRIEHHEVAVVRGEVVPLVDLARTLKIDDRGADAELVSILVTRLEGEDVGLIVESFQEGTEVIVKPMEGILGGSREFCGTALMGDGSVLLVLDVKEVLAGACSTV